MSKRFALSFCCICAVLLCPVFTGCERKKDSEHKVSASGMITEIESYAELTDDEASVMAEIVQCGMIIGELTGGDLSVPEPSQTIKRVLPSFKDIVKMLEQTVGKKYTKIPIKKFAWSGVGGLLTFAFTFMELTEAPGNRESIVDYLKRSLTDQEVAELKNIKAGADGWFLETQGDGYAVYSRVTRIDGAYTKSLDDLIKIRQNTPKAQAVIKRIETKVISGGVIEIYTGINNPSSKSPTILHTVSYNGIETLSCGFTYNTDSKVWNNATITKKTGEFSATCNPSINGIDWDLNYENLKQTYRFLYDPKDQHWSGYFEYKILNEKGEAVSTQRVDHSGVGLLTGVDWMLSGFVYSGL